MSLEARWWRNVVPAGARRQMIGTAAAGLILGLGGVTIGSSLVHASERGGLLDFFEDLFRGSPPAVAAPPAARPGRYANLPDARRVGPGRPVLHTPRPAADPPLARAGRSRGAERRPVVPRSVVVAAGGQRTVCVRTCDGYLFPLGRLAARADLPVHRAACAAACPGAPTSVYTLAAGETELDRGVSPQGLPYRASALANIYRQRRVADCACQPPGGAPPLPISEDRTLRPGDVVATRDSAAVVARTRPGSVALVDFRSADLTRGQSLRIEAKVGTGLREAEGRAFRRALRAAQRGAFVRVAAMGEGLRIPERAAGEPVPVRVVAPSPFPR